MEPTEAGEGEAVDAKNTLQFKLKMRCKRNKKAPADTTNPEEIYTNSKVYTRHVEWEPLGNQREWLKGAWVGAK